MPRRQYRSMSDGSFGEVPQIAGDAAVSITEARDSAKTLLQVLLHLTDGRTAKSFLHQPHSNLTLVKALLDRSRQLDDSSALEGSAPVASFQRDFLLRQEPESGYNPLHSAILHADLPRILLYLRHVASDQDRFVQRPISILQTTDEQPSTASAIAVATNTANGRRRQRSRSDSVTNDTHKSATATTGSVLSVSPPTGSYVNHVCLARSIASQKDREGLTPIQLLGKLQLSELEACRKAIRRPEVRRKRLFARSSFDSSDRRSSFDMENEDDFHFLSVNMDALPVDQDDRNQKNQTTYACEVVTFGRPQHCALGVHSGTSHGGTLPMNTSGTGAGAGSSFRPQRVKEFAQDTIGRMSSAVAVAAAAHHTLVVQRDGQLYAFGLGKGGRLGTGTEQSYCPLPVRVMGPLTRRRVVNIAAADNHSLCVTTEGHVYSWGSNRFGQLGLSNTDSSYSDKGSNSGNCRYLPRRVEELKHVPCVSVAAGERHSIALSREGEVYVWGDNSSGQLGVSRRSGAQKVQRVESLWNTQKVAIQVAASAQSTLVLCGPSKSAQMNSIFSWGHGNHVPIRLHFDDVKKPTHVPNPIMIACGRFHNAAITRDGCVYTWGFHADSLGRAAPRKSPSSPQLVSGISAAVALSASEHHTAVVTDTGALYTWGTADGKHTLGHEGQRWQPSPKRVPGIHRAVGVAVAKEHTVVLVGGSFPAIPNQSDTLEDLATRKIAEHVDLFNVLPILIMAERTQSHLLTRYCTDFIRRNLDGVINLAQKSVVNQYLEDMLSENLHASGLKYRDGVHHPFVADVLTAGCAERPTFDREWLCSYDDWARACYLLYRTESARQAARAAARIEQELQLQIPSKGGRPRATSFNNFIDSTDNTSSSNERVCDKENLDQVIKSTTDMDLSTSILASAKLDWISKEIRGTKKRLGQISKLESQSKTIALTKDQVWKVNRKEFLRTKLGHLDRALSVIEKRMGDFMILKERLEDSAARQKSKSDHGGKGDERGKDVSYSPSDGMKQKQPEDSSVIVSFFCAACGVKCPDEKSYVLHNSGRKHRNRMLQVAETEKAEAAASIIAEQRKQQVMAISAVPQVNIAPKPVKKAWVNAPSKRTQKISTLKPKYILPPPPHSAAPPVSPMSSDKALSSTPPSKPCDLRSIMTEQASQVTGATDTPTKGGKRASRRIATALQKAPPVKSTRSSHGTKTMERKTSLRLSSVPVLNSTPARPTDIVGSPLAKTVPQSTRCMPSNLLVPSASTAGTNGNSYSLAHFLTPPKTEASSPKISTSSPSPVWGKTPSPKSSNPNGDLRLFATPEKKCVSASSTPTKQVTPCKTLLEIQQEEVEFKTRQDETYGKEAGSWYIERRERAGSFQTIQEKAAKAREEEIMIQEQFMIEAQIQKELQQQQQQQKRRSSKKNCGAKSGKRNRKGNQKGSKKQPQQVQSSSGSRNNGRNKNGSQAKNCDVSRDNHRRKGNYESASSSAIPTAVA